MDELSIRFYQPFDKEELNYQLPDNQQEFTALPLVALTFLGERNTQDYHMLSIVKNKAVIGFFALDYGEDKLNYTTNEAALLVRSLSINPKFQGKGYGTLAMQQLLIFVKDFFPTINELVLGVNRRNISAYKIYINIGYSDTGNIFVGRNGDQHILTKKIY